MQNYASLREVNYHDEEEQMVHTADPSRPIFSHIADLDSFFSRLYRYHQKHGYFCMVLQEVFELNQFFFIVSLTTYLIYGIDYPVMFGDFQNSTQITRHKASLSDAIYPLGTCVARIHTIAWLILSIATFIWFLKLLKGIYQLISFWEIKQFYNLGLMIGDSELDNLTWHEVQTRVRAVQVEQRLVVHSKDLSDLDIYHRILRHQNYLVALVNKRLLPPRVILPLVGELVYWSRGLAYNVKLLLFWSPWSPFDHPWHLREEYRREGLKNELAANFKRHIVYLAAINFLLSPLILLWQILYAFFNYAEMIKREPGTLGIRHWSLYGRLYLRHFNELEHELQARLSRAHRPASKYLAAFSSPYLALIGKHVAFICGSIFAVLVALTIYDEDVLNVEHVITLMTGLGAAVAICRSLIPDETTPWCPETLLTNVVAHTHYLPHDWKGQAHTTRIRSEFQQLFQYRVVGLLEELVSPLATPIFLLYWVYPRATDILTFFRHFSVDVDGLGDICTFAQMNLKKHGNTEWHQPNAVLTAEEPDQYHQGEDGKVELSLIHFTHTNPRWKPPNENQAFVENVQMESSMVGSRNTGSVVFNDNLDSSLPYTSRLDSLAVGVPQHPEQQQEHLVYTSGMWRNEGPSPNTARDMTFSAIYLHELHYRQTKGHSRGHVEENTPLLARK